MSNPEHIQHISHRIHQTEVRYRAHQDIKRQWDLITTCKIVIQIRTFHSHLLQRYCEINNNLSTTLSNPFQHIHVRGRRYDSLIVILDQRSLRVMFHRHHLLWFHNLLHIPISDPALHRHIMVPGQDCQRYLSHSISHQLFLCNSLGLHPLTLVEGMKHLNRSLQCPNRSSTNFQLRAIWRKTVINNKIIRGTRHDTGRA